MGFNFLCWLMVDRLSERIKMEENYSDFLANEGLQEKFAAHLAAPAASAQKKKK